MNVAILIMAIILTPLVLPLVMIGVDVGLDSQPDSILYSLEQIGEDFRGVIDAGVYWDADRCLERAEEALYMVEKGDYQLTLRLVSESAERAAKASIPAKPTDDLDRLENRISSALITLENVQELIVDEHVGTVGGFKNTVEDALDRIHMLQEAQEENA